MVYRVQGIKWLYDRVEWLHVSTGDRVWYIDYRG